MAGANCLYTNLCSKKQNKKQARKTKTRARSFLINSYRNVLELGFSSLGSYLNVVWMFKLRCLSKIIFILPVHLPKNFQKNMLNVLKSPKKINSTADALAAICKNFSRTNILDGNGRLMLKQLNDLNSKWRQLIKIMPSLLAVRVISPFEF